MSALREEVNTLKGEVDRLVESRDMNNRHILEMIKDLKEEFDVI